MTVEDLASLVLSKADTFSERELERQRVLLAIERAQTPEEIRQILTAAGLNRRELSSQFGD